MPRQLNADLSYPAQVGVFMLPLAKLEPTHVVRHTVSTGETSDQYVLHFFRPSGNDPKASASLVQVSLEHPVQSVISLSTKLQGRCVLSSWYRIMLSHPVRQAPGEPGRQNTIVRFDRPANTRD